MLPLALQLTKPDIQSARIQKETDIAKSGPSSPTIDAETGATRVWPGRRMVLRFIIRCKLRNRDEKTETRSRAGEGSDSCRHEIRRGAGRGDFRANRLRRRENTVYLPPAGARQTHSSPSGRPSLATVHPPQARDLVFETAPAGPSAVKISLSGQRSEE